MISILKDDSGIIELYSGYFKDSDFIDRVDELELQQESIILFGKQVHQPRLSRLFGKPNTSYKYSGKVFNAIPWSGQLKELADRCSEICQVDFNTGLLNYYRDGNDSMGIHADDERELGRNPTIASVSFGVTRSMIFRKRNSKERLVVPLNHGDLLIMKGCLQHHWKHELPKERKVEDARLNITFRKVN